MDNFIINDKVKQFIFRLHNTVINKIPKSHFVFRNRLLEYSFDLYENVLRANLNTGSIRSKYQKESIVDVDMIDALLGYINDLSYIEKKKFMSLIANLNEIKKCYMGG